MSAAAAAPATTKPAAATTVAVTETDSKLAAAQKQSKDAVLVISEEMPSDAPIVKGYDFNAGINYEAMFQAYATTGFQATQLAQAVNEINRMIKWRLSDEPYTADEIADNKTKSANELAADSVYRSGVKCTIFLGYTSNMMSCGQREVIRYLAQHRMIDCIVTTAGGVEEDFIKCLAPFYLGDFKLNGKLLRSKGLNRIGNLLVPNSNYRKFEDWFIPILDAMRNEQNGTTATAAATATAAGAAAKPANSGGSASGSGGGMWWTPSKIIARLGEEIGRTRDASGKLIDYESSVYYWCWKNSIPVFCPALTDGSIGDMIYFRGFEYPGFRIDIVSDLAAINQIASMADKSGAIILGGGLIKHHICNANLMRNGADYAVYINTAHEWDGSDAGATPDEAISWGKIKVDAQPIKLAGEASLLFPIVVAQTFAKEFERRKQQHHHQQQSKPSAPTTTTAAASAGAAVKK